MHIDHKLYFQEGTEGVEFEKSHLQKQQGSNVYLPKMFGTNKLLAMLPETGKFDRDLCLVDC